MSVDAFVNQHCPNCDVPLAVRADDVRVTARDEEDEDLATGLCRLSTVWSCNECSHMGGHTWYVSEIELSETGLVQWVGDLRGAETCIVLGPQDRIEHDWSRVRREGGRA